MKQVVELSKIEYDPIYFIFFHKFLNFHKVP